MACSEMEVEWEGLLSGDAAEEPGTDKLLRLLDDDDRADVLAEYDVFQTYLQQIQDSEGFDVTVCPKSRILGLTSVIPLIDSFKEDYPELFRLSELAIDTYNKDKITEFKVVEVEKANLVMSNYDTYLLTFTALDKVGARNFQAIVCMDMVKHGPAEVTMCRMKKA